MFSDAVVCLVVFYFELTAPLSVKPKIVRFIWRINVATTLGLCQLLVAICVITFCNFVDLIHTISHLVTHRVNAAKTVFAFN